MLTAIFHYLIVQASHPSHRIRPLQCLISLPSSLLNTATNKFDLNCLFDSVGVCSQIQVGEGGGGHAKRVLY